MLVDIICFPGGGKVVLHTIQAFITLSLSQRQKNWAGSIPWKKISSAGSRNWQRSPQPVKRIFGIDVNNFELFFKENTFEKKIHFSRAN